MPAQRRRITVVLVDGANRPLGELHCGSTLPFLQDVSDWLPELRARGVGCQVLRLVSHHIDAGSGVADCVYVAQLSEGAAMPVGLTPTTWQPSADAPRRLPYARVGGVAADLAWAEQSLRAHGRRFVAVEQHRTWNLSCVHRLLLDGGSVAWLKAVPPFFAREGTVIAALRELEMAAESTSSLALPSLLAFDRMPGRLLLRDAPGELLRGCAPARWQRVVEAHVDRQLRLAEALPKLLALGLPDHRDATLATALARLIARDEVRRSFSAEQRSALDAFAGELPARIAALSSCGLPNTLVHGDLHPGNVIGGDTQDVLLDWGDAVVGNPLLDVPGLCHGFNADAAAEVRAGVVAAWQRALPGADIRRAMALSLPIAEARRALVYQGFLDAIEDDERHYHANDVATVLRAVLEAEYVTDGA